MREVPSPKASSGAAMAPKAPVPRRYDRFASSVARAQKSRCDSPSSQPAVRRPCTSTSVSSMKLRDARSQPRSEARGLAPGVAVEQARNPDVGVFAFARVSIGLDRTRDRLVIRVASCRWHRAASSHRAPSSGRCGREFRARRLAIAALIADVVVEADVEQVVERPPVVVGDGETALVLAGGLGAAVVERERQPPRERLVPVHDQIAVTRAAAGCSLGRDPDVCLGGRNALEVFEALLDRPQIEQLAFAQRQGVAQGGTRTARLVQADGTDKTREPP